MNNVNNDNDNNNNDEQMVEQIKELSKLRNDIMLKYNDILNLYNSFNFNLDKTNEISASTRKNLNNLNKKY